MRATKRFILYCFYCIIGCFSKYSEIHAATTDCSEYGDGVETCTDEKITCKEGYWKKDDRCNKCPTVNVFECKSTSVKCSPNYYLSENACVPCPGVNEWVFSSSSGISGSQPTGVYDGYISRSPVGSTGVEECYYTSNDEIKDGLGVFKFNDCPHKIYNANDLYVSFCCYGGGNGCYSGVCEYITGADYSGQSGLSCVRL